MKRKYLLSSLVAAAAFASGAAQAGVTPYVSLANYAAWSSQINFASVVQDNFNDNALAGTQAGTDINTQNYAGPYPALTYLNGPGIPGAGGVVVPSGISYLSDVNMYVMDANFHLGEPNTYFVGDGFDNALNVYGSGPTSTGVMKILAPAGGYGIFGLDIGASEPAPNNSTFSVELFTGGTGGIGGTSLGTFSGGTLYTNPTGSFFGAVSTAPISYALITPAGGRFSVDNVKFGNAVTTTTGVPEPSSIALLGLGLAALGWKSRRKATV